MDANDVAALPESQKTLPPTATLLLGAAFSALCALGALSFHQAPPGELSRAAGMKAGAADVTLAQGAPQWAALRVGTAHAAGTAWSEAFPARFRVDEARAARVGAPLAGRVTRVLVELGDPVKAGQPLFSLASADVAALRVELQRAKVEHDVALGKHERVASMVAAHALPGKDEVEASAELRESELGLRLANAKLASLHVSGGPDNELTVLSPRDGVVVEKNLLAAQQVEPDQKLLEVADTSEVWAVAQIFEADAQGLAPGARARLTRAELPGFACEAKVDMVSSVVDPEDHSIAVRVVVPNPDRALRPNTYVEMRFEQAAPAGAVEIAADSLVSDGPDKYVYVEREPGHFVRRQVVASSSSKSRVIVTSGLSAGERVVEEGSALLDNAIALAH
jgi:RND family efflux transporter MFP subunit